MKMYAIAWRYKSPDSDDCDDFGIVEEVFDDSEKANAKLLSCAEEDFNEWCAEEYEPKMTHEDDYAKVEDGCGGFFEYRVLIVRKEG